MIYNIFMKYILIVITVLFSLNIFSKELIIDVFGKEEVKTYAIDENNFFRMVTTKSVFKTNTNIYGNSECAGTTEIYNKNVNNLFYTGQLTVPGPGVPPSLISGKLVADYIIKNCK